MRHCALTTARLLKHTRSLASPKSIINHIVTRSSISAGYTRNHASSAATSVSALGSHSHSHSPLSAPHTDCAVCSYRRAVIRYFSGPATTQDLRSTIDNMSSAADTSLPESSFRLARDLVYVYANCSLAVEWTDLGTHNAYAARPTTNSPSRATSRSSLLVEK